MGYWSINEVARSSQRACYEKQLEGHHLEMMALTIFLHNTSLLQVVQSIHLQEAKPLFMKIPRIFYHDVMMASRRHDMTGRDEPLYHDTIGSP